MFKVCEGKSRLDLLNTLLYIALCSVYIYIYSLHYLYKQIIIVKVSKNLQNNLILL